MGWILDNHPACPSLTPILQLCLGCEENDPHSDNVDIDEEEEDHDGADDLFIMRSLYVCR